MWRISSSVLNLSFFIPLPLEGTASPQLTPCREPPHTAPTARTACPTPNTPFSSEASPASSAPRRRLPPFTAHSSPPSAGKSRPPSAAHSSPPSSLRRPGSLPCLHPGPASRAPTPPPRWICYGTGRAYREGGIMSGFWTHCSLFFPCPS